MTSSYTETAAAHLVEEIPTGHPSDTVAAAIAGMAAVKLATADTLYVVDGGRRLVGSIAMCDVLRSDGPCVSPT